MSEENEGTKRKRSAEYLKEYQGTCRMQSKRKRGNGRKKSKFGRWSYVMEYEHSQRCGQCLRNAFIMEVILL